METNSIAWYVIAVVALLSCTPSGYTPNNELKPELAAQIQPPPQYTQWLLEVEGCVQFVALNDTTIHIVKLPTDATAFSWFVLSSERDNGTIPCVVDGQAHSCFALSKPDSIVVSAQFAKSMAVIKHELMHQIVDTPRERVLGPHGPPWGFCEYLW